MSYLEQWATIDAQLACVRGQIAGGRACKCGSPLARTNESGRCHLCATRSANATRTLPEDFAVHAAVETNVELRERYGCCADVITRFRKESGVLSSKGRRIPELAPDGFRVAAPAHTKKELRLRYNRGGATIDRWLKEARVECKRYVPVGSAPAPRQTYAASSPQIIRAAIAAEYLRRFGPVVRCDPTGNYSPTGDHWRRGSTLLGADEIIARALRNGWRPDAWKEVRAA